MEKKESNVRWGVTIACALVVFILGILAAVIPEQIKTSNNYVETYGNYVDSCSFSAYSEGRQPNSSWKHLLM